MAEIYWSADNVATIAGFLSAAECDDYIRLGEATGFEEAPITTSRGMMMMTDVRNNDRVMIDDPARALALYQRLSDDLAPRFQRTWTRVAFNERLRLYRYDIGQQFDWHRDGYFQRPNGERSFFTFMVYLNDDFDGGATSFSDDGFGFPGYHPWAPLPTPSGSSWCKPLSPRSGPGKCLRSRCPSRLSVP